jgi:hypothetical protein
MVANDVAGLVAIELSVQGILTSINKSTQTIDKAVAEYSRVLGLKGAGGYKEYVSIQTEAALKEKQALAVGKELADYVMEMIGTAKSGLPLNLTDSLKAVRVNVNALDKLERELVALRKQASDYAADHF